jgi:hypothetical protein|tara:strand:- start:1575 stop:1859 length:285 start_codon:yes stop_codon:yes gene_type:complete
MAIENVQQLLTEQLGKNRCDVITTTAMTGKDYYAVYFPVTSIVSNLEAANATTATGSAIANLETTLPAGTSILLNVTAITLTSGIALCYYEQVI